MAREYGGDLYDLENMSDDEIRTLVLEQLREYPNLEADDIDVRVRNGTITLAGRVGTDAEVQVATSVLDDVLGVDAFEIELVVDELRRGEVPTAADDASADDNEIDEQVGEPVSDQSDTAEHLSKDLDAETYGTHDMGKAIRDGSSYSPPDRPVSDGYGSREEH